jgi:hypothetical protein
MRAALGPFQLPGARLLTVPSISVIWSPSSTVTTVAKESEVLSILTTGSGLVADAGEALWARLVCGRVRSSGLRQLAVDGRSTHLHMTLRPRLRTRGHDGAKSSTALPRKAIAI